MNQVPMHPLSALHAEASDAERILAEGTANDDSIEDQLAAAGDVRAARLRLREVEAALPTEVQRARVEAATAALAPLFETQPEPLLETEARQ